MVYTEWTAERFAIDTPRKTEPEEDVCENEEDLEERPDPLPRLRLSTDGATHQPGEAPYIFCMLCYHTGREDQEWVCPFCTFPDCSIAIDHWLALRMLASLNNPATFFLCN